MFPKSTPYYWGKRRNGTESGLKCFYCSIAPHTPYGAFSVSRPQINGAIKYIENQKEHHKTQTFKEEFLTMLKMGQIQYDEKYLWD